MEHFCVWSAGLIVIEKVSLMHMHICFTYRETYLSITSMTTPFISHNCALFTDSIVLTICMALLGIVPSLAAGTSQVTPPPWPMES